MFKLLTEPEDFTQHLEGNNSELSNLLIMGSKRTKKVKQELEIFPDKDATKKNEENGPPEPAITTPVVNDVTSTTPASTPKAPKRKKKNENTDEVPKKVKKTNDNESDAKKVKVKKKRVKKESENKQMNGTVNNVQNTSKNESPDKKKEQITWPEQDIIDLINRMETNIPEQDVLAYRSRVEKLNWENVAFKNYTADDCKKTWLLVQKRIRRFRLLKEMLHDAKEWVNTPRINHKLPRPKKHPDMPRRPLSSYLLFYLKKKDEIISENPGLYGSDLTKIVGQIYKNLPPEKREKYEKMAATNREEYVEKLKLFFESHPELVPPQKLNSNFKVEKVEKEKAPKIEKEKVHVPEKVPTKEKPPKVAKVEKEKLPKVKDNKTKGERKPGRPPKTELSERPPKKCQTPFGLYFASEMKNMEPGADKSAFRDKCKQQYKQMADKKKVYWINLAEQDLIRYQDEVKAYKAKYPEYKVHKVRSILTKREKASKERAAGKPMKPPNSAYALYSRVMLQSEEIKSVHPKDRMNYIASKWKTCTEEEQNSYKDQVVHLLEQYKQEYQTYVDSLPEEEKRSILQQSKKKGRGRTSTGRLRKPRKRKTPKVQAPKTKFTEPEQPPISACKYFATLYKGDGDAVQAWKALGAEEKRKYENELVKKKQAYIVEFEKFLKSLSKEELEAFSKSRQQQVQSDDDESSDCSSDSDVDEEEDEDDEDVDERNEENGDVPNEDDAHESDSE